MFLKETPDRRNTQETNQNKVKHASPNVGTSVYFSFDFQGTGAACGSFQYNEPATIPGHRFDFRKCNFGFFIE